LRRLNIDAKDYQPPPRAFDLGAEIRGRGDQNEADREHDQGKLADLARREKRRRDQDGGGRYEKEHLPVDEMERVEADASRYRRTRSEAEHDAAEHQRAERRQREPVNRPPPFAQRRWLCARGHGIPKANSRLVVTPGWF